MNALKFADVVWIASYHPGEKLRAYLSSLPAYRKKLDRPGEAIRAKDLYDITRILQREQLPGSTGFWKAALAEFRVCCESR